jgi:hypothetical protein
MSVTGRNRPFVAALLLTVAAFATQRSADAGFIASNLGEGNSSNPSSGDPLSGPISYAGIGHGLAVEVQVWGTSSIGFGSGHPALEYRSGEGAVDALFLGDNRDLPGSTPGTKLLSDISSGPSLAASISTVDTLAAPGADDWQAVVAWNDAQRTGMTNYQGKADQPAHRADTVGGRSSWQGASSNSGVALAVYSGALASGLVMIGVGVLTLAGYQTSRNRRVG